MGFYENGWGLHHFAPELPFTPLPAPRLIDSVRQWSSLSFTFGPKETPVSVVSNLVVV